MAAPDFPNSPTLNQQYTAPNGILYTWDGAVWTSASAVQGAGLWSAGSLALYPTDTTKNVGIFGPTGPGTDLAQLQLGTRPVKSRIMAHQSADWFGFALNGWYDGSAWHADDATKPLWVTSMYGGSDTFNIGRAAGSAPNTQPTIFQLSNTGLITSKAYAGAINGSGTVGTGVTGQLTLNNASYGGGPCAYPQYNQVIAQIYGPVVLFAYVILSAAPSGGFGVELMLQQYNGSTWTTVQRTGSTGAQYISLAGVWFVSGGGAYQPQFILTFTNAATNVATYAAYLAMFQPGVF